MGLFEPVDFDKYKEPKKEEKTSVVQKKVVNEKKLEEVISFIQKEINKIRSGESDLVPYPIYDNGTVIPSLNKMIEYKSLKTIENFINAAQQDFGTRFKDLIEPKIQECIEDEQAI